MLGCARQASNSLESSCMHEMCDGSLCDPAAVPESSRHAVCRDDLPSLAEALALLKPAAPLGVHPADQQPVTLAVGKFGPYVRHGKVNAPIPKVHPQLWWQPLVPNPQYMLCKPVMALLQPVLEIWHLIGDTFASLSRS